MLYTVDSSDATTKVERGGHHPAAGQRNYDKTVDRQRMRAEVKAGVVKHTKKGRQRATR